MSRFCEAPPKGGGVPAQARLNLVACEIICTGAMRLLAAVLAATASRVVQFHEAGEGSAVRGSKSRSKRVRGACKREEYADLACPPVEQDSQGWSGDTRCELPGRATGGSAAGSSDLSFAWTHDLTVA